MPVIQSKQLASEWKARLNLSARGIPDLYENADDVGSTPHAAAIRTTLEELGASAVFCIQGVPTIAILSVDKYDRDAIVGLHAALWNQGLSSLLLVISGDTVRAFSLARIPHSGENHDFDDRCLVQELNSVSHALMLKDVIYGVESGRFWEENASFFPSEERIDHVLLDNLTTSHKLLCRTLSFDAAQALLVQAMFIAYLEDREIIRDEYFLSASDGMANSFSSLLRSGNVRFFERLFKNLREDFNGNLFVAPCSFDEGVQHPRVSPEHLKILMRFRSGREEMHGDAGQYRFWGYNFKYMPIELISAVYDRFLGENREEQREKGAYYTPMFLADTVISQVWNTISLAIRDKGRFLDPACGSGIFLVRAFQLLCEHWREKHPSRSIRWDSLCAILSRLHGWDIDGGAVRVAVFSLYVALLEEVSPPDIRLLIGRGRFLPEIWGRNLRHRDFFTIEEEEARADVLIGNPPWSSRRGSDRFSVKWCRKNHLPMPSKEEAWAFVWKSLRHVRENGVVAFILPAMAFLHNHAKDAVAARNRFMHDAHIIRIINFADIRFQLFEDAVRPAALFIFGRATDEAIDYRFDYWVPKSDLNLKIKRTITLGSGDKCVVSSRTAEKEPSTFNRRRWMNDPEAKLFNYLSKFPTLGELVEEYGELKRKSKAAEHGWVATSKYGWVIGQGFKPANMERLADPRYKREHSEIVATQPYLDISDFRVLAQSCEGLRPWANGLVTRRGFEEGFRGPRILIPQGVDTSWRLRAIYTEKPLTFRDTIQALVVPRGQERRAKLLTAILNSKLMSWVAFHRTGSFGSDRPKVHQSELLYLPFPSPSDMSEEAESRLAEEKLVSLIDRTLTTTSERPVLQSEDTDIFGELDPLTYQFFCLSDDEIILIDDTIESIVPAIQPRRDGYPDIWKQAERDDRRTYATTLIRSIEEWFDPQSTIGIRLEARNQDLAILRLTLEDGRGNLDYEEKTDGAVGDVLADIFEHIHEPLPGNFQLVPDFRVFIGNKLYLVKPTQKRFWLRSAALADADSIALDLQSAISGDGRDTT